MVAEIQRLEDAARTAMGDYSQFGSDAPARAQAPGGFTSAAVRVLTALGRAVGRSAA